MDEQQKNQLLTDMQNVLAEPQAPDNEKILFHIQNYQRPSSHHGQHDFQVEGAVQDIDGAKIAVWLFADENDRLYELEFVRWDNNKVVSPKWETLDLW